MNSRPGHNHKSACIAFALVGLLSVGTTASALSLAECTRTTHISHGGEADHRDLGAGRVMWRDWWSQEGTATGFAIVECDSGATLRFRTAEENMGPRLPFDRTAKALAILARFESTARAFAGLERIAADLKGVARDIDIMTLDAEPCACAAAYPDRRGDKTEFMRG